MGYSHLSEEDRGQLNATKSTSQIGKCKCVVIIIN